MESVYYSIAGFRNFRCERQWVQSVRSLRKYNQAIPIYLCLYDSPSDSIVREAERQQAIVCRLGDYDSCLRELIPERAAALSHYPVLHKLLSLRSLPLDDAARFLYLDCDTFFFGDIATLFRTYHAHDFYAREEPWSRRSHYEYRSSYLDEDCLRQTARSEGLAFIPPYNTGVCLLNYGVAQRIAASSRQFLDYAWRLLIDLCSNSPIANECDPDLVAAVRQTLNSSDMLSRLTYPSSNWWIVEQIAMLLTLGSIPGLSHHVLLREHTLQNGEHEEGQVVPLPTVVHYFSHLESRFFSRVQRI